VKIGVQISSLRPFLKMAGEVRETFIKMKKIGYDYAQIQWISPDVTDGEIHAALRESGLICAGTQEAMDEVLPSIDKYIEKNLLWGGKYITVGSLGAAGDFKSREGCVKIAERFNRANEKLRGTGLTLAFHPLNAHILKIDGKNSVDIIMENMDSEIQLCLDVFHIKTSGNDPAEWIKNRAGKSDQIHFKDFKTVEGRPLLTPVGQGITEWSEIFEACETAGVKYAFAEQEHWEKDAFLCMEESYLFMKSGG